MVGNRTKAATATLCVLGKWFVIYWTEEPAASSPKPGSSFTRS